MQRLFIVSSILVLALIHAVAFGQPAAPQEAASVKPGINQMFVNPDLEVAAMLKIFESESREIFARRKAIVKKLRLAPGMAVADVGAGTGLFIGPFAQAVGTTGKVYAVDISPRLVEYMQERIGGAGLTQVEAVLCSERSVDLPEGSVDVVFASDTYHHFEYPESTMASIHRAIRPGGRLVIVDFERIPGLSREWVVGHVRVGKKETIAEIESAGFVFEDEPAMPGLVENYLLRFKRP